jgi:hypothetical protein
MKTATALSFYRRQYFDLYQHFTIKNIPYTKAAAVVQPLKFIRKVMFIINVNDSIKAEPKQQLKAGKP